MANYSSNAFVLIELETNANRSSLIEMEETTNNGYRYARQDVSKVERGKKRREKGRRTRSKHRRRDTRNDERGCTYGMTR